MGEQSGLRVAGVDEVGRGALFGPVVAAAVVLDALGEAQLQALGVTDSKKLSAAQRDRLSHQIRDLAQDWQIGVASVREIDRLNILQASLLAMRRAVSGLNQPPDLCQIDGNRCIPGLALPQQAIIKGDQAVLAIAAASILAKVWRDQLIARMARRYPAYDLGSNKGYGTQKHRRAIQQWGPTPFHRRSFAPCQLVIEQRPLFPSD